MGVTTMKVFLLLGLAALASGAPRAAKLLKNPRSTPLSRGGGRIVGGEDAYYGEFPHQIMLLRGGPDGSLMCGGSLISSDWVVTAAHCCDGQSASRLGVAVGAHNLYTDDADQENIQVSRVVMHESYDDWKVENDICLLQLESSATMGSHVGTISLPSQNEEYESGTMCTVTGWGTTSEGGSLARVLQKVSVPVVSDEDCRDAYGSSQIADSMMCAGFDRGGRTLARVILVDHSCVETSCPVLYHGAMAAPRLDTQE